MQTTFSTNLRCQKCVAKITPILDNDPSVRSWSADVDDPRKTLTVDTDDPAHVDQLMTAAGYKISPLDATVPVVQESRSWLETYRPLLLVVAYVAGMTAFVETIHGSFDAGRAMSHFMGFFFLGFAFFKLLNVSGFADAFSTYDIIAKRTRAYALAYPFIELGLGLLFLSRVAVTVSAIATILVMAVGLVGVIAAVQKKQAIQCACLGTVFNLPMSVVTIIENSVMIAMAIAMITIMR